MNQTTRPIPNSENRVKGEAYGDKEKSPRDMVDKKIRDEGDHFNLCPSEPITQMLIKVHKPLI